jgi:phage-related protein
MAVVGSAQIIVRAITKDVARDIERGVKGAEGAVSTAGKSAGRKFSRAFSGSQGNFFQKITNGLKSIAPEAEAARAAWVRLQKVGFVLQSAVGALAGSLGALVGGLGAVAGAIGGAIPAALTLVGVLVQLKIASALANFALGGVGAAAQRLSEGGGNAARSLKNEIRAVEDAQKNLQRVISDNADRLEDANDKVTDAQNRLNRAIREGREELQQLNFDAEDAALAEKKAALELERARETLARVQDLPPNSRARRDAELAFAEADLNLRRAIDANRDLAAEQARIGGDINNLEGVIDAEKDLADAIENRGETEQENTERLNDANEALRRAKEDLADAQKQIGGSNPLAGLTASQASFAQFLADIKPKLDELKEAVASGFLPVLETQIKRIIDQGFPTLKTGFTEIGVSLGTFVTKLTDAIVDPQNLERLGGFFTSTAKTVSQAGDIAGDGWEIFLILMEELEPLIRGFMDFLVGKVDAFKNFLNVEQEAGRLTDFFTRSGEILADLAEIFGNVFGGLGDIIMANFEPGSGGDMMLQWLKTATASFAEIGDGAGMASLKEFFQGAAGNSIAMFQSIGALIGEIIKLGADPNIKIFWNTLKEGAPFVGEILRNGQEAAPALADLVVSVTKIVAAFADSGAPKAFFETLNALASTLADILNNKVVKSILDFFGPVIGIALAFSTIAKVVKNVGLVIAGNFGPASPLVAGLGAIQAFFVRLILSGSGILGILGRVGMFLTGPWGIAIAAAITALTYFFTQTEVGKEIWANFTKFLGEAWDNTVKFFGAVIEGFISFFTGLWEGLTAVFQPVLDFFVTAFTTAFDVIRAIFEIFSALFLIGFVLIGTAVQAVWDGIKAGFKAVSDFLRPIVEAIANFFKPIFKGIGDFINTVWQGIQAGFKAFYDFVAPVIRTLGGVFETVFKGVSSFFKGIINGMIGFAEGFVNFFIDGLNFIIDRINTIKLPIPALLQPVFGGARELGFSIGRVARISLPRLAEGGIVAARPGGMLAQIAEAGRAERVEPLDSSGLSVRDRAMIEMLSKNGSGLEGNINISVYPAQGMNESELATKISRVLALQLRKGAAS